MSITGTPSTGIGSRLTLGKESTWGTGVTVTDLFPYLNESISQEGTFLQNDHMSGRVGREIAQLSTKSVSGAINFEPVLDTIAGDPYGWELILLAAMGTATWDATNSLNKYTLANTLATSLTAAINKEVAIWEFTGLKVTSLEISGAFGGSLTAVANVIGKRRYITGDAGITNTTTTVVTNIAPTAKPDLLDLKDATFRLGAQGAALAASDKFAIGSFTLRINNGLSDAQFATCEDTGGHTDPVYTLEPARNDYRAIEFEFTIPRYADNQTFTWESGDTALQADLKFAVGSKQFNVYMPNVKFMESPQAPVSGPGLTAVSGKLTCLVNGGTNTDMTFTDTAAITNEIGIELKTARTAAP